MKKEDFILDGIGGEDDTKRFNTEKIEAIEKRLREALEDDFKKFDLAKRRSIEDAWRFVVD